MAALRNVCVYCGSGSGQNPAYRQAAEAFGRGLAAAGVRLVYGGGSVGLMGVLARSALDAGGQVTGIIPHFLESRERVFQDVTELIVTDNMHERKMLMFERADAFVALPGGVGTLEELVEQMTWAQLGRHEKPVLLANVLDFWQPLIELLEHMRAQLFIRPEFDVSFLIAQDIAEIVPMLREACAQRPRAALDRSAASEPIRRM